MTEKTFNILKQGEGEADNLRGRDVEFKLRGVEIHPMHKAVLIQLAERNHINTKAIAEISVMFDKMIDNMQGFADIAHNMKTRTDQLVRSTEEQDSVPEDTSRERN